MGQPQFIRDASGRFAQKPVTPPTPRPADTQLARRFGRLHSAIKSRRAREENAEANSSRALVPAYDDIYDLYHCYAN